VRADSAVWIIARWASRAGACSCRSTRGSERRALVLLRSRGPGAARVLVPGQHYAADLKAAAGTAGPEPHRCRSGPRGAADLDWRNPDGGRGVPFQGAGLDDRMAPEDVSDVMFLRPPATEGRLVRHASRWGPNGLVRREYPSAAPTLLYRRRSSTLRLQGRLLAPSCTGAVSVGSSRPRERVEIIDREGQHLLGPPPSRDCHHRPRRVRPLLVGCR